MDDPDKKAKILLIMCFFLVTSLGITSGMIIKTYFLNKPHTTNQTTNQTINQSMNESMHSDQTGINKTSSTSRKAQNTSAKYVTTICKNNGKNLLNLQTAPYNY